MNDPDTKPERARDESDLPADRLWQPTTVKWFVAVFGVVMGAIILLVSVIREKLFTRKSDRYKGIQR